MNWFVVCFFFRILLGGLDWPGCAQCRLPTPGIHFVRNCLFRSSLRRCLSPTGTLLKLSQFDTFFLSLSLFFCVSKHLDIYPFSCERVNNILLDWHRDSFSFSFFFFFEGIELLLLKCFLAVWSQCIMTSIWFHCADINFLILILFLWFWQLRCRANSNGWTPTKEFCNSWKVIMSLDVRHDSLGLVYSFSVFLIFISKFLKR